MDMYCILCNNTFEKRASGKGYKKLPVFTTKLRGVRTKVTIRQAINILYQRDVETNAYVCADCFLNIERTYRQSLVPASTVTVASSPSDAIVDDFPVTTDNSATPTPQVPPQSPIGKKKNVVKSPRPRRHRASLEATAHSVFLSVRQAKYYEAFRKMLATGPAARKAFRKLVEKEAKVEMKTFIQKGADGYPQFTGTTSVKDFSWSATFPRLQSALPTVVAALTGSMPRKTSADGLTECRDLTQTRIGMMLSIPLYSHRPATLKFVQAVAGIQLYQAGASNKVLTCFNKLGLTQGHAATRRNVDIIVKESEKKGMSTVEHGSLSTTTATRVVADAIEGSLNDSIDSVSALPCDLDMFADEDATSSGSSSNGAAISNSEMESDHADVASLNVDDDALYSLVCDNTPKLVRARVRKRDNRNKMLMFENVGKCLYRS